MFYTYPHSRLLFLESFHCELLTGFDLHIRPLLVVLYLNKRIE